jgi:hypothetical protein
MTQIEVGAGLVQLRRDGQDRPWARLAVSEILNVDLFLALAQALRQQARQKPGQRPDV